MTFDYGVLKFDYPKSFSFQSEQDTAFKSWTLNGNDLVITYYEFDATVAIDEFITERVKKFGKKNCSISDKQIKLGDIELAGKRINITLIGQKLTYDMYLIKTNDNKTHLISFQDSKKDDGSDSDEAIRTILLINKTITHN